MDQGVITTAIVAMTAAIVIGGVIGLMFGSAANTELEAASLFGPTEAGLERMKRAGRRKAAAIRIGFIGGLLLAAVVLAGNWSLPFLKG